MYKRTWLQELTLLLICFTAYPLVYLAAHNGWLAASIPLLSYLTLMLWRINKLNQWLQSGMPAPLPHAYGVLEHTIVTMSAFKRTTDSEREEHRSMSKNMQEIMTALPIATVIINRNQEIEWSNYAALELLGIDKQRDTGIKIINLIRHQELITQLSTKGNHVFEMPSPLEPEATLAIQTIRYAQRRTLVLAQNITPQLELQRSRKKFIANASHELRTPLTVVSGYLEFMHSDPELSPSLLRPVEQAMEQATNMETLINDLLVLSRLEDNALDEEQLTPICLQGHLQTLLATLKVSGKIQQHTIISSVDDGLTLRACTKELDSICLNLITNALKYSEDTSSISVQWSCEDDRSIRFSVTDQGIGIAAEHITHLTERFYRVDSGRSRKVGGTGLGLSIVKHCMERHHGYLEIHSQLGKGSTFTAVFPHISSDN